MPPRLSRAPGVLVLVWLTGVVAATVVGLLAVRLVGAQVGDPAVRPLTPGGVERALAAASPAASSPGPAATTPTPAAAPAPAASRPATSGHAVLPRTLNSAGGSVGVDCAGTTVRILFAQPAAGYALDKREQSGSQAEVRFEGGGQRVRLEVSCASGSPVLVRTRTD